MLRASTHRLALRATLALIAASVPAALPVAVAAEYCVICGEPDGVYRCIAADVSAAARDTGAQLQCIQDIARRAGHRTCTIQRGAGTDCNGQEWVVGSTGGGGMAVTLPPGVETTDRPAGAPTATPSAAAAVPDGARSTSASEASGRPAMAPLGAPREPSPRLEQGVNGQTYYPAGGDPAAASAGQPIGGGGEAETRQLPGKPDAASGSALDKAGKAVGGAAKKTWDCVSSLFSRC